MFDIDFDRLIALLLPTFLRQPVIYSWLHAAIAPLKALYDSFCSSRADHNYRLTHNGQVCYLKACLNDHFKSSMGTIKIITAERDGDWIFAITESGEKIPLAVSENHDEDEDEDVTVPLLSNQSVLQAAQNDFIVSLPSDIYDSSLEEVKALVNQYKLITKRAIYISQTT